MLEWLFSPTKSRWQAYAFMAIGAAFADGQYAAAVALIILGAAVSARMDAVLADKGNHKP